MELLKDLTCKGSAPASLLACQLLGTGVLPGLCASIGRPVAKRSVQLLDGCDLACTAARLAARPHHFDLVVCVLLRLIVQQD